MNQLFRPKISLASLGHGPRDIIVRLLKDAPDIDRKDTFEAFRMALRADEESRRAVDWYFFVHMYDDLVASKAPPPSTEMRERHRAERRVSVDRIKAQIALLDLTMPNGKPMRDCTGQEMAMFGNRFQKVADKVGKAKLVGEVLDEDQVREIMGRA